MKISARIVVAPLILAVLAIFGPSTTAHAGPAAGSQLWLRADAGVTSNGAAVSTWADQSGHLNNAYMPTASRQPTLVNAAIHGLPVVRFNGAQSLLLASPILAPPSPRQFTVFIVGKNSMPYGSTFSMILGPGGSNPNNQLRWDNGTQALFVGTGNNMPVVTPTIGNTNVYHILSARYDGSTMTTYRDGNAVSTNSFVTTGPWTLNQIGAWFSSYFMVGDLAEIIVYPAALSDADLSTTTAYLNGKYFIAQIKAGNYHTCALTGSGGVKCWGGNAEGQLGNGSNTDSWEAGDVNGLKSGVASIGLGAYHTCAVTNSGGVQCWGDNGNGQLGIGSQLSQTNPTRLSTLTSGVSAIAGGEFFTCALTMAGGVKCWGDNTFGQLGDGTTSPRYTPYDVPTFPSGVKAIATGYNSTCVLTSSSGVKCWGYNVNGELGRGTKSTQEFAPADVKGLTSGVTGISAGLGQACALLSGGGVLCWGKGNPTPVPVSGVNPGVTAIAQGPFPTCVLTSSGGVQCWGDNSHGEIGDGSTTYRPNATGVVGLSAAATAIGVGAYHSCAIVIGGAQC